MTITATQVLEMLSKAEKLDIQYEIVKETWGYTLQFTDYRYVGEYKDYSYDKVYINNSNESNAYNDGWDFLVWMNMLDEKLEEKEQEKIKEQKRQELIARLSDEERELLDLGVSFQRASHTARRSF
jgi:nuclear transport factor 2 (NTF2) superfamily protein